MHWIKTIRENLRLTQNEAAAYLYLSVRTIQSIEQCRRELPFKRMGAAIALYNAMKAGKVNDPVREPLPELDVRTQRKLKGLHRRCCHRLVLCREKLQKMQVDYENARQCLKVYQLLAENLAMVDNPDDVARLKWIEWRIVEAQHRVNENNATAQGLLNVEIAALESRAQGLEKMLATHTESRENCPDVVNHRDAPVDDQRSGEEETGVHGDRHAVQQEYVHPPLRGAETASIKRRMHDGYTTNGILERVERSGWNPHSQKGRIAADASFVKGISGEVLDNYSNNDAEINAVEGIPRSTYSRLVNGVAKPYRRHNLANSCKPVMFAHPDKKSHFADFFTAYQLQRQKISNRIPIIRRWSR